MSAWAVFTWLAIGVLICGSFAIFAWFLRDARVMLRGAKRSADLAASDAEPRSMHPSEGPERVPDASPEIDR